MAIMKKICDECGRPLSKDEVGLNKKLISRETEVFLCIDCLSEQLDCDVYDLQIKIDEFKEEGCALFL